jgi:superfamily II DNA or RNA helicase
MLLQAAIGIPNKVLMLSATIVDKPDNFAVFGYLLGLSNSLSNMRRFISSYTNEATLSAKLHDLIFPIHGSRLKISSLGNNFPKNIIITDTLYVDKDIAKEIDNNYKEIKKCLDELKNKEIKDKGNILSKMLRSRQKIEMLKLPMLISLINDNLENNLSVVVFLNFNESIKILSDHFHTNSLIWGSQTLNDRDKVIENFQNNVTNLIIANVGSGSTGISLHDLKGKQRTSLISPGWSSIQLSQCLGRIYRSGSKTPAIQRLLYTSGTIEETIASKIRNKLKNLSLLNDGDLI